MTSVDALNEKNQRVILSIQDLALKQAWWYMLIIPVVGRLWWGFDKIKLNLAYIVNPEQLGLCSRTLYQKLTNSNKKRYRRVSINSMTGSDNSEKGGVSY